MAGAVAREFGLELDRHLRDDAHPLSQAPDADEIGSTPAASTYCAGSSSPPVQSLDSTAGLYGSAPRTVFAALDLSSYHAVHAGAARDAVTVDDATVLPSTDHGEAQYDPRKRFRSAVAAHYYSLEVKRFVRVDRPTAWLLTLAPNGATSESARPSSPIGHAARDVLDRVTSRGTREVAVKLNVGRVELERFMENFHTRALRRNVAVATRALAFTTDCSALL